MYHFLGRNHRDTYNCNVSLESYLHQPLIKDTNNIESLLLFISGLITFNCGFQNDTLFTYNNNA